MLAAVFYGSSSGHYINEPVFHNNVHASKHFLYYPCMFVAILIVFVPVLKISGCSSVMCILFPHKTGFQWLAYNMYSRTQVTLQAKSCELPTVLTADNLPAHKRNPESCHCLNTDLRLRLADKCPGAAVKLYFWLWNVYHNNGRHTPMCNFEKYCWPHTCTLLHRNWTWGNAGAKLKKKLNTT